MKTMRIVLGFYQLLLSASSLVFIILVFVMISRPDPNVRIHWLTVVCAILLFGAGAGFCAANGVQWVAGSTQRLIRWKGLTPISILFTVLLTFITAVMLARTDWNSASEAQLAPQEHPLLKQKAPGFSAVDIEGHSIGLYDLIGKHVLLDFWASWCSPCVSALPDLQHARETFSEDNLVILGINRDRDIDSLKSFLRHRDYSFTNIFDEDGEIFSLYSVSAIPMNFLIDPNGIIVAADMRGKALLRVLSSRVK